MVIDVAHNPAGAWALRSALSERYEDRPLIFVFGAMRDKAISEMTEILFPLAERVIATRPENPRAASPEEIQQAAARTGVEIEAVEDVQQALERARALAAPRNGRGGYGIDLSGGRSDAIDRLDARSLRRRRRAVSPRMEVCRK